MLTLKKSTLPAAEPDLRAALVKYRSELGAHRLTVGVPAPWPDFDVLRDIVAAGGEFDVLDDLPPPPTARELALKALADEAAAKAEAERVAREDSLLAAAASRPDAPQAVRDYIASLPPDARPGRTLANP